MFTVKDFATISSFGYLGPDVRQPPLNKEIFVAGHPDGRQKELSVVGDQDGGGRCRISDPDADGTATNSDAGYYCQAQQHAEHHQLRLQVRRQHQRRNLQHSHGAGGHVLGTDRGHSAFSGAVSSCGFQTRKKEARLAAGFRIFQRTGRRSGPKAYLILPSL